MLLALTLALQLMPTVAWAAEPCFLGQGYFAGEVRSSHVWLQTRLTSRPDLDEQGDLPGCEGIVAFEIARDAELEKEVRRTPWHRATAAHDFIVRAGVSDLQPATRYFYRAVFGRSPDRIESGPIASFRTLPAATDETPVRFVMGSCMHYTKFMLGKSARPSGPVTATEEDKRQGYPVFAAMRERNPDFFIGTGDIVYYDHSPKPSKSVAAMRQRWHEQFRFPRLRAFFGQTASFWSKDDHDFRFDDADLRGDRQPSADLGIELFREQMPIAALGDTQTPTYRTVRLNRWVQLWFVEGRDYRDPNRKADGPEKSLWGAAQRQWLKETLAASDAPHKILISPTPMVGPDDARKRDNHANLKGFQHEANAFFAWLGQREIDGVIALCGDRHWQYHSMHPSGFEEFACGALNDENSRRGVKPGAKRGTDPEGKIRQPFQYAKPSGGFLEVVAGPTLEIIFRNDEGEQLYAWERGERSE